MSLPDAIYWDGTETMKYGKFRHTQFRDIPYEYLQSIKRFGGVDRYKAEAELTRRRKLKEAFMIENNLTEEEMYSGFRYNPNCKDGYEELEKDEQGNTTY